MVPSYLNDLAFAEKNDGPYVLDRYGKRTELHGRNPSPRQIRKRCEAIRRSWSKKEAAIRVFGYLKNHRDPEVPEMTVPLVADPGRVE